MAALELGFSVKAGPLSQIGIQIFNLDTAVQLAVGAYGWWKAGERCKTLCQLFEVTGGQLVASSTFNLEHYRGVRHNHHIRGTVAQQDLLQSVVLPHASTAVSTDNSGLACLRASTSALLCFYTVDATVLILTEVIPHSLIQLEHIDATFSITGALFSSLRTSVQTIAAEEDSDTFRKYLLEQALADENMLFQRAGGTKIIQHSDSDLGLSVGMLKWALTPTHRRDFPTYVTMSLAVWLLATVMKRVGFEVSASPLLIVSEDDAERYSASNCHNEPEVAGDVVLNASDFGSTDLYRIYAPSASEGAEYSIKPQLMPIQSIPLVAYMHVRQFRSGGTEYLADIFNYVFREMQRKPAEISMVNGNIKLGMTTPNSSPNHFHDSILASWSPHVARFAGAFLAQYAPVNPTEDGWNILELHQAFDEYKAKKNDFETSNTYDSVIRTAFHTIQAIMLGIAYGIIHHFLDDSLNQSPQLSHVVFSPVILKQGRLVEIISILGRLLNGNISHAELCAVVAELILRWPRSDVESLQKESRLILGMQRNGLTVLSRFALRPSLDATTLSRYSLAEGHILNLRYVALHGKDKPSRGIVGLYNRYEGQDILLPSEEDHSKQMYRLSLEPYWEESPREAVFRLRREGVELFPVSPATLRDRLLGQMKVPECRCESAVRSINVPTAEHGIRLPFDEILPDDDGSQPNHSMSKSNPMRAWRRDVKDRKRTFVDARDCVPLQVAVLGMINCKHLFLSTGCLKCTYEALPALNSQAGGIVLMLTS